MDIAHLHLMLNHVPVIGIIFGLVVLAWGIARRSDEVKIVGLLALIVTALVALPVYFTGEPAEEIVEKLPGVSGSLIELHEDWAAVSLIFAMVAGALAFVSLITRRAGSAAVAKFTIAATLLFSASTSLLMVRTANLGGQIRHSEIRGTLAGGTQQQQQPTERRGHDDDH